MLSETFFIGGLNTRGVFADSASDGSNKSTYTFDGFNFNAPHTRRRIAFFFDCGALLGSDLVTPPSSATIGGVSATLLHQYSIVIQLWGALVPTGTDGTITVTRAAGNMTFGLVVGWSLYDLKSFTPVDSVISTLANPSSASLNTLAGGVAIGLGGGVGGALPAIAWTGLTSEGADGTVSGTGSGLRYGGASKNKTLTESLAITSDTDANNLFMAASFR
jgi:hypothetical protein